MLKDKTDAFLKKYSIYETTVLIAFSGGYDSMCLLDIILNLKDKFKLTPIAIHLNHNWRGEESRQDEENCREFCKQNGIEFYSETLNSDVKSTETDAREARYRFFEKCAQKFESKIVFTAHNADDNAETLLYRVAKGTGIEGLKGICEKREIFYRPLLTCYRKDIETYCREKNLSPNNDSSNQNVKYKRNLLRKNIIPELEKINKDVKCALNSLSENANSDSEIINEYLSLLPDKFNTQNFIKFLPAVQKRIIYNLLSENNFEYDQKRVAELVNFINTNSNTKNGKTTSLTDECLLFASRNEIRLIRPDKPENYKLIIQECTTRPENFPPDSEYTAYVNLALVGTELELRHRCDGDIIFPLGSKGSQKLKKYLNYKGIPKDKRDKMPFLCLRNEVLWAPGLGISEKIKVKENPTHILKLERIYEH